MRRLLAPALVVATLWLYAPVGQLGFLDYDDALYVTERPEVLNGLSPSGAAWAFTNVEAGNWHPLTWLSHMLDVELFGQGPRGPHLVNAALHALCAALLYLLLARATGAPLRAAFAAAVFALHPQRVESVAWIAERKDLLSGFWFLVTLGAYGGYVALPSAARAAAVLAAAALGLLSKSMLVTLPGVLLLLDVWPLGRLRTRADLVPRLREKVPLVLLCALLAAIALVAQAGSGSVTTFAALPLGDRVGNALVAPILYLRDLLWPTELAILYPHPRGGLPLWQPLAAAALLGVITVWAARQLRTRPYWLIGWLWFLVMLLPVIGLVQVGAQARADRYTYLPLVGPVVAATWGIADLCAGRRVSRWLPAAACAVLVALAFATRVQLAWWRDDETLFARAAAVTPDNAVAYVNWAKELDRDPERQRELLLRAIAIEPRFAIAHFELALSLSEAGDRGSAEEHYRLALRSDPYHAGAHNNLANLALASGHTDEAIAHYRLALALDPERASTTHNLAVALRAQAETFARAGRQEDAQAALREAVSLETKPEQAAP